MTASRPRRRSSRAELDAALERVARSKDRWTRVGIPERIRYLRRCMDGVQEVAGDWVRQTCSHQGIDPDSNLAGEVWLSGPMITARTLRLYARGLSRGGRPKPVSLRQRADGQVVAQVFPASVVDRLLYAGMSAEVWIEPGRAPTQGRIYREKESGKIAPGRVALVLGAGNISSIPPLDAACKLFAEDQVVVLKMNPVNDYLGPVLERAMRCLVDDGFLAFAYGGKEEGDYLCHHPRVDTVHLTGSHRTHDEIVWGEDPKERDRRKATGATRVRKPVTSELGCVTPILVAPGVWTRSDLDFHARHVASMVTNNASFNCNAGKVLVLARGWPQREVFLERLRRAFAEIPARRAYYPGAQERYREFVERYPRAEVLGGRREGVVPWTLIPDVPAREAEYALSHEAFCGVLAEVSLEAHDPEGFLARAVELANERIWGSLSCMLLVDPRTERGCRESVERAVAELRYGTLGINVWSAVSFGLGVTSWGAFPGHPLEEIGSGRGVVHNAYLFDHPQKSVFRAPFRIRPKPIWFADHRNLAAVGRLLARYEARPSIGTLARIAVAALRA